MKRSNLCFCVWVGREGRNEKDFSLPLYLKVDYDIFPTTTTTTVVRFRSIINKSNLNTQHKPRASSLEKLVHRPVSAPRLRHNKAKYQFYKGSGRLDCLMGIKVVKINDSKHRPSSISFRFLRRTYAHHSPHTNNKSPLQPTKKRAESRKSFKGEKES